MDAIVEVSQFPTSRFYELGQKHDLIMLPIDPANQEKLNKELGTSSLTIPAGTYSFQKEDCPPSPRSSCSSPARISRRSDHGRPQGHDANIDYLHSVHANLRDLSPETMSANTSIPMHPAAEKFFRELKK